MPHIFHVMDVSHMSWHMLLGRPWIHYHRCVPSSWHQCIKVAPFKTGQIRVRGLKNPFAIEEAHFYEASYFIEPNILAMARQNEYTSYPAIVDLPSHVKPTANYPPKLTPKKLKTQHSSASSVSERSQRPDGSLIPFKVVLHAGRPSPYAPPPTTYAKNEEERNQITEEDRIRAHNELCSIQPKKVLTLPQSFPQIISHDGVHRLRLLPKPKAMNPSFPQPGANFVEPCMFKNSNQVSKQIFSLAPLSFPTLNRNSQSFVGAVTFNSYNNDDFAELEPVPNHFEEGVTITAKTLIEVDLGDASEKQPTFIGSGLSENE